MLAADEPAGLADLFDLGLLILEAVSGFELFLEHGDLLLVLDDGLDAADGATKARLQGLFGELFLIEGDDFLNIADAAAQIFAEADDLANDNGRSGDGLHDADLPTLNALGYFYFALTGEQRNGTHLAEVHADGIVGLLEGAGREVELDVVGLFPSLDLALFATAAAFLAREHIDSLGVDGGEEVVEVVRRGDITGQKIIDLPIGQITLFLACIDQFVDIFFVLVEFFSHDGVRSLLEFDRLGFNSNGAHGSAHREDSLGFYLGRETCWVR